MRELQNISFKYFYNFKANKILSPIFSQGDIQSLKPFTSNKDIINTKADKSRDVVIVHQNNYIISMETIISDRLKCIPMILYDNIIIIVRIVSNALNSAVSRLVLKHHISYVYRQRQIYLCIGTIK